MFISPKLTSGGNSLSHSFYKFISIDFQNFNATEAYPNNSHANEENKASLSVREVRVYGILVGRMLLTQSTSSIMSPELPLLIIGVSIVPKRLPVSELWGDAEGAALGRGG